ncbi:diaminopimelate decarboxylase [Arsenicicoccus sp. oral taxon 190]|uniref:diaminopimelate decarboxylase n=1 Tax=Arsenicicoccus sp. oral taxon 190 TaxID=1658671 RepID=UPI00067A2DD4|nr:diaminopimelate decarboxylase [Arsenicicoccus sp. oral taxon 190]AKT52382.1 diaminopimelate decarboxylase [Arsenicicoccus sp. oral taxon 190]
MHAHEAGALHAPGYSAAPEWLPWPDDVNALEPGLWPRTVTKDDEGVLTVAGVPVTAIQQEFGTPAYVIDEDDFRARARDFRTAYDAAFADVGGGADVYYAGKAFLCTAVARWVREEGLHLDVCSGGELATALRAGMPGERIGFHGNNKSAAELEAAVAAGVGRIIVDSHTEIDRVSALARDRGVEVGVMVRVTAGVEAHTHEFIATAHEDQKFGFSLSGGEAFAACERIVARPGLRLLGLHSHIGSQIFETSGFELSARRILGLHARVRDELGVAMPEVDLGGGYGIAYTTQHSPLTPTELAEQMAEIVRRECRALELDPPRVSIEPGRAIAGPSTFTLYEVGTVKQVHVDRAATRLYVSVDGGMSDNIRTALYGADYSCTMAGRRSDAHPVVSRVVGRHCESGDVVVRDEYLPADVRPGDLIAVPGTGAYCRAMASQYNHTPRPPVVAVRDGAARVIVRRETIEDLLALDVADA